MQTLREAVILRVVLFHLRPPYFWKSVISFTAASQREVAFCRIDPQLGHARVSRVEVVGAFFLEGVLVFHLPHRSMTISEEGTSSSSSRAGKFPLSLVYLIF